jgi:hypothetical protein
MGREVDLTMQAIAVPRASGTPSIDIAPALDDHTNLGDEERGLPILPHAVPLSVRSILSNNPDDEPELQRTGPTSENSSSSSANYLKRKTSQIYEAVVSNGVVNIIGGRKTNAAGSSLAPALVYLVDAYATSDIAAGIKADGEKLRREVVRTDTGDADGAVNNELPDVVLETSILRGRKRASWGTQFRILSGRAFKNLYRDPALLAAHYLSAIGLAGTFRSSGYNLLF